MRKAKTGFLTVALALTLLIGGCNRQDDEPGQITICFAFQDLETEYWVAAHKAITETLRARNIKVLERNAHQDANRQFEQIRDAIAQDVDGIIMIPQDGESALTIIGEANQAGIPIGVFNRPPADKSKPALVVVADNEEIAEEAVAYMAKTASELSRKMTPLILVGDLGDQNSIERRDGFYHPAAGPQTLCLGNGGRRAALAGFLVCTWFALCRDPGRSGPDPTGVPPHAC